MYNTSTEAWMSEGIDNHKKGEEEEEEQQQQQQQQQQQPNRGKNLAFVNE